MLYSCPISLSLPSRLTNLSIAPNPSRSRRQPPVLLSTLNRLPSKHTSRTPGFPSRRTLLLHTFRGWRLSPVATWPVLYRMYPLHLSLPASLVWNSCNLCPRSGCWACTGDDRMPKKAIQPRHVARKRTRVYGSPGPHVISRPKRNRETPKGKSTKKKLSKLLPDKGGPESFVSKEGLLLARQILWGNSHPDDQREVANGLTSSPIPEIFIQVLQKRWFLPNDFPVPSPRLKATTVIKMPDPLVVMKVWFIAYGFYFWEFVTTFDYEWSVFRGRQRYRWTIWIYSGVRLSCLAVVILTMINFGLISEINCQAWIVSVWVITDLGCYGLASILIMLRIFAIWDKNKVIMGISAALWVANMSFQFAGIFKGHAVWVPAARACVTDLKVIKYFSLSTLISDISLLLIMLAGLLRLRLRDRAFIDLALVLWKQGVIWLVIATLAEAPQAIFQFLDVDETYKSVFLMPALITIVIAATRTYRALTSYGSTPANSTGPHSSNLPKSSRLVSSGKDSSFVHIPGNRLEVAMHKVYEEYPMSPLNKPPPHELGLHDNV